jgi:hypothetical protein
MSQFYLLIGAFFIVICAGLGRPETMGALEDQTTADTVFESYQINPQFQLERLKSGNAVARIVLASKSTPFNPGTIVVDTFSVVTHKVDIQFDGWLIKCFINKGQFRFGYSTHEVHQSVTRSVSFLYRAYAVLVM